MGIRVVDGLGEVDCQVQFRVKIGMRDGMEGEVQSDVLAKI